MELEDEDLIPPPPPSAAAVPMTTTTTPMTTTTTLPLSVGFLVPGGPIRTDFVPVDASGTKYALTLSSPGDLPCPLTTVHELVGFLATPCLPPDHGVLVYWQFASSSSVAAASGFELLGSLTTEQPSQIFRTGWSSHDQLLSVAGPNTSLTVTIGLSVEPMTSIRNVQPSQGNKDRPMMLAQQIGRDLFQFMQSFDTGTSGSTAHMMVPHNIFERWWKRFQTKSARDPNFFWKQSTE